MKLLKNEIEEDTTNESLVSIIIPVYNCENFIRETIQTIQNQTYTNWEAIFVDDCSSDKSIEILTEFLSDKIKLVKLEKNSGAAVARNEGIKMAKGKYIAFLDGDDFWHKQKLEKQVNFMEKNNYAFTCTSYEFTNEHGEGTGKIAKVPKQLTYKQALKNTVIFTSSVIFNVQVLGKKLIQMPNFKRGQDTATWWKVLRAGNIVYGLNEVLAYYRRSSDTLSSNKLKALKRTWTIYRQSEKFSIVKSAYYFLFYVFHAIKRRI